MAKQAHIYIYGDIIPWQDDEAENYGCVNLKNVIEIINANADAEEILVHIHSRGGDVNEGFAIYDALMNSGKTIITSIEGRCFSIATVIALSGSVRKINENAEFMIHNAWADPFTMQGFNADDYQEMAEVIRAADARLLALYVEKTGASEEDIRAKMEAETYLTADEALTLGFVTEKTEPLKAVAYLKKPEPPAPVPNPPAPIKKINMSKIKELAAKAMSGLKALAGIQAAESALSDGSKIYYDGDLAVGTEIFTDAEMTTPAGDGELVLEGGNTLVISGGKVTEIKEAASEDDDVVALQARISALEAENATLKAENTQAEATLVQVNARLANVRSFGNPRTSGNDPSKFTKPNQQAKGESRFTNRVKVNDKAKK